MATVKLGTIITDIRGSVDDQTFFRNQGGICVRTRTGPAGEPTAAQIAVTDTMTDLSREWSATLTESERDTWRQYAHQFPQNDTWGTPSLTNGYTRFIQVNFDIWLNVQVLRTTTAPTHPPLTSPLGTVTACAAADRLYFHVPILPDVPPATSFALTLGMGLQQPPGVNFYASPYKIITFTSRTKAAWTAAPVSVLSTENLIEGKVIWGRLRLQDRTTFAVSPPAFTRVIIEA